MDFPTQSEWRTLLPLLTPSERETLDAILSAPRRWSPLPGPQTAALRTKADVILFGGAAGGGKSDLALGKALTQHRRSLILRREYPQLKAIHERAQEVYGPFGQWNGRDSIWRCSYQGIERVIEFGSCQHETDKVNYQGRPHDLLVFDEAANFLESQVRFISGWIRTEMEGQVCQLLLCSNPPTGAEGIWLLSWFSAWLDPKHPRPAAPGELRWFASVDKKEIEVPGPEPFRHNGETITPKSRTFIPARVSDNPYYLRTGYVAQLQALPEPLRSMMLKGDFAAGQEDDRYQVVPSDWVRRAQARWHADGRPPEQMTALGVDVARGGSDATVLSPRYGTWFAAQQVVPGASTPDGPAVAALVAVTRKDNALVNVDVIGVGASVYDQLRQVFGLSVVGLNGSEASTRKDRSGRLGFANRRAEWWWAFREALDPETGDNLTLPPDAELLADLCAPTWKLMARGIQVEAKDEIIKRIGRSPDRGDSAVYAYAVPWLHEPLREPLPQENSPAWHKMQIEEMEAVAKEELAARQEMLASAGWEEWGA